MGMGYTYRCSRCGKEIDISLGVGMMYPSACENLKADVLKGKYGEDYKQVLTRYPEALVDAEQRLYKCKCGFWHVNSALNIVETEEKTGRWCAAEPFQKRKFIKTRKGRAVVIKRFRHLCPICGGRMKDITNHWVITDLTCPRCGATVEEQLFFPVDWD